MDDCDSMFQQTINKYGINNATLQQPYDEPTRVLNFKLTVAGIDVHISYDKEDGPNTEALFEHICSHRKRTLQDDYLILKAWVYYEVKIMRMNDNFL